MTIPQKEYIITEEQLKEIEHSYGESGLGICNEAQAIRSRPITSAEQVLDVFQQQYTLIEAREVIEHIYGRHTTCKSERINCPLCVKEIHRSEQS